MTRTTEVEECEEGETEEDISIRTTLCFVKAKSRSESKIRWQRSLGPLVGSGPKHVLTSDSEIISH